MDSEGHLIVKPFELERAELIDGLCRRYGALPSAVLAEDVEMLRMLIMIGGDDGSE